MLVVFSSILPLPLFFNFFVIKQDIRYLLQDCLLAFLLLMHSSNGFYILVDFNKRD